MTCFGFSFALPLSLPFDWTFKILRMCLLFCFACLSGCYVVMLCVKINKKMLIKKRKKKLIPLNFFGRRVICVHLKWSKWFKMMKTEIKIKMYNRSVLMKLITKRKT